MPEGDILAHSMNIFAYMASKLVGGPLSLSPLPGVGSLCAFAMEGNESAGRDLQQGSANQPTPSSTQPGKEPNETTDQNKDSPEEDAQWVEQARNGNTRAFDQLVSKHRGRIYAMIYNMVKNDADAWDLSQEAFIKAWRALPQFESRARFSTWLFRISHNVVYDWLRKRRIQGDGELNDEIFDASRIEPGALTAPKHDQRPDQALEQSELQERINNALGKLSDEHREVIVLREVQGLDYKEIADIIGSSMGTVMSRLYYARQKLQGYLKSEI